jgi:3-isopropylmalate/(R)-2-methylmalate dehydratase small subunit
MEAFTQLTAIAAPLNMMNVDTDKIIPKQYLKTIKRTGLARGLFAELRYDAEGRDRPDFILNQPVYRDAKILVAGRNFGCGSSREHAPWALLDFGFRCIIAPSFADIFYNNMLKNMMLPVVLPEARVNELMRFLLELPGAEITVDLAAQTVTGPDEQVDRFEIGDFSRDCLLKGIDEIGITEQHADSIVAYEERRRQEMPWLPTTMVNA